MKCYNNIYSRHFHLRDPCLQSHSPLSTEITVPLIRLLLGSCVLIGQVGRCRVILHVQSYIVKNVDIYCFVVYSRSKIPELNGFIGIILTCSHTSYPKQLWNHQGGPKDTGKQRSNKHPFIHPYSISTYLKIIWCSILKNPWKPNENEQKS